ncbi:DUF4245 domain-containing protein [Kytococcus sedentarius]|uniref:DUF4245 domain-containing protein n=1 Tax=Kytococcus sedentarius TaxID=1276 RepID=UPI0035BC7640
MTDPTPQQPAPQRRRGMGSWRSMFWSTVIVVGIVLIWVAMVARPDQLPERSVDAAGQTVATQRETRRDLVEAVDLPAEWNATHAELRDEGRDKVWHVTYSTPQGKHLSLDQRIVDDEGERGGIDAWVGVKTGEAEDAGTLETDGRTWDLRLRPDPERRSAVLTEAPDDTAVVVSGDAPEDELRTLVEALRFDGAPEQDADGSSAPASAG